LQDYIGAKSPKMGMIILRSARMSIYNSREGATWFYWDQFKGSNQQIIFMFCKFDLKNLDPMYPFKSWLKNKEQIDTDNYKTAFFNSKTGKFIAEKKFIKKLSFQDGVRLAKECQHKNNKDRGKILEAQSFVRLKSGYAIIGKTLGDTGLLPVVLFDVPEKNANFLARDETMPGFILVCIIILVTVNIAVFSRGPRITVGRVLIAAIIMAILMPALMSRSLFALIMKGSNEKEKIRIERDLYSSLTGIDNSYKIVQLEIHERLRQKFKDPATLARIREEENQDLNTEYDSVILDIATYVFKNIIDGYEDQVMPKYRELNTLLLSGPNDFIRYFNKFSGDDYIAEKSKTKNESLYLLLNLMRRKSMHVYSEERFDPELLQEHKKMLGDRLESLKFEEVQSLLKKSFGVEKYHDLMNTKGMVSTLKTSFGRSMFTAFPVEYKGKFRYFVGSSWDEFCVGPCFLRRAFDQRASIDKGLFNSDKNDFFSRLDPARYIERRPVSFMAFDGFRFDMFATDSQNSETMLGLLKKAYRSKLLLKQEVSDEKNPALYVAYPGRNLSVYILGAQQGLKHLQKAENARSAVFVTAVVLFLFFSVLAAVNIGGSLTNPLQHLLWGLGEVKRNNYRIRLKDSREDEFGSISKAFNQMVKRLGEKDTLGRFVSESVRKLAADPELLKRAAEGAEEEVTVLFASLQGFEKFALSQPVDEIERVLTFTLKAFFKRTQEFEGEIDKVIGEKVLIIFPHKKRGRKKAVASAISLVKKIKNDFRAEKKLQPVFGLNTGSVISGIIGAANEKMDYTVIGDTVNVAARLASVAEKMNLTLCASGVARSAAIRQEKFEKIQIEKIKGKKQEVEVYKVKV
jgi:class 3 adenylate cyclase